MGWAAAEASILMPLVVMCFFFSRGMLVSAVFLQARGSRGGKGKQMEQIGKAAKA